MSDSGSKVDLLPRLFFMHIPKTGGTTLTDSLYSAFGPLGYLREVVVEPDRTLEGMAKKLNNATLSQIGCVIGHFHFGLHSKFQGDFRYVTMLRNPVKRVLSLYYHIRDRKEHPLHETLHQRSLTSKQFFSGELTLETQNDQTRRIAGAEGVINIGREHFNQAVKNIEQHVVCVGLTERYDESMVLFTYLMPELGDLSYAKVLNRKKITLREPVNTTFNRALIASGNEWDIKLYEYANNRFAKQVAELENWTDTLDSFRRRCEQKALKLQRFGSVHKAISILRNKCHAEIRRHFLPFENF